MKAAFLMAQLQGTFELGQSVTLSGPNDGPLVPPPQKFGVLPERAIS
jgi:hypothetical protein